MEMNIVYASDNNYADILGTSMLSLFENNKMCNEINVYILNDGINDDNKKKILQIGNMYKRKVVYIDIPNLHKLAGVKIHTNERWSLSTFSRLFLERILPDNIEQVLYLDCDTLINDSLEELFMTDLNDKLCAGVSDCISDGHKNNVGLVSDDYYINAGVMLISLKNWKNAHICDRFIDFINRYNGNTPYVDQGVINGTMRGEIMPLDLKYNVYTALFDFNYSDLMLFRKPLHYYSESEVRQAINKPAIVHFTTSFLSLRPWIKGCEHPYVSEWLRYKSMTPWSDEPLRADNRSLKKKVTLALYNILPKVLAVRIAGWIHAIVVPKTRKIK